MVFAKIRQTTKLAKWSLFLQDNAMMVTREIYEANIGQLVERFRVREREMKIMVEALSKQEDKKPPIEYAPNFCSEVY